ncbi:MAG TPA: carboxypeptidase-like regulatory domain-containing protein, partial [Bryobacteraceae bacterium]|nr:carboxypeptidase-like regulatory domain-containing protein [Bryobacteraceae bacterium]
MRAAALLFLALRATAAVLQGVVLDEETGNPLARTTVTLTPLPGVAASPVVIMTGDRGAFSILSVRVGWYLLKTSRRGYADTEAGQMRPGRPGMPFEVQPDAQSAFFQIRMRRLAAVTGSVLDENSVGIPEWPVHIYTARKPVRRVAEGKTDDRGVFRVGALDPGAYLVRSGPGLLEDQSGLVPTFYKYGTAVETAESVRVKLGETQTDVAIRPVK